MRSVTPSGWLNLAAIDRNNLQELNANSPLGVFESERKTGVAYNSPFKFQTYGQCGIEVSELFEQTAECTGDICLIRSTHCSVPNHPPSTLEMTCGDPIQTRPSMGS